MSLLDTFATVTYAHTPAEHAVTYARSGLAVLPLWWPDAHGCACARGECGAPGKHPVSVGAHGATTDPGTVRAWWDTWPEANIGIVPPPGIVVLDVDPRNNGATALLAETAECGRLAPTWATAQTYWCPLCRPTESVGPDLGKGQSRCVDCTRAFIPGKRKSKTRCPQCAIAADPRSFQCAYAYCLEWFIPDPRHPHRCARQAIGEEQRQRRDVIDAAPWWDVSPVIVGDRSRARHAAA